ncbi:tyrosine-type recombinase/integrase [Gordonia sp. MP11Mi]|uniref:Tyrosine recombinase XerC n=1 Tax=Gordonia sp. MP11Mi TaxID=3022769 RepID=A0AA97CU55_9ACTN
MTHATDEWAAAIERWRTDQTSAGVSKPVVSQRLSHVNHCAEYLSTTDRGPWTLETVDLVEYLDSRSWSALTRRNNVKSLRALYRWAVAQNLVTFDPAVSVPVNLSPAAEALINRHRVVYPEHVRPGPAPLSVPAAWSDLIARWKTHARSAGLSVHTINVRESHMERVGRDLHPSTPADVTTEDLEEWLAGHTDVAREYRRSLRSSLRALFGWAADVGQLPNDPSRKLRVIRAVTPLARPASSQDYRDALARADDRQTVILMLAAEMGLRRAEVAQVHANDILDTDDGPSLIIHGKGDKKRLVPMTPRMYRVVRNTLKSYGNGYLLPGATAGSHLTPAYVARLAVQVLPDRVTLHQLRHRFATVTYSAHNDVLSVQQLLGHASPATTQRYVAVDASTLRATVESASGAYPRTARRTTGVEPSSSILETSAP